MKKKRKHKKSKKFILSFSIFSLFILICAIFAFSILWRGIFLPVNFGSEEKVNFLIERGEGAKEISENLKSQGLIKWTPLFRFYVFFTEEHNNLKAGEYLISKSMNVPEMAEKFVLGNVVERKIFVQEGWDLRDIAASFEDKGMFTAEEFFGLTGYPGLIYSEENGLPKPKDFSQKFDFLKSKPDNLSLEGFLFPDTYEIFYGETADEIVIKMLANFEEKMKEEGLFEEISASGKTVFEIITMASILEKEVNTFKDKKIASGVLWKRLEIGMPLQADATVNYSTGKNSRWVPIKDTKTDSLYNTYKHKGLPLGPISNPGIESIKAALRPELSPYLYYLSTRDRITIFSQTLKEHNYNKAVYLR